MPYDRPLRALHDRDEEITVIRFGALVFTEDGRIGIVQAHSGYHSIVRFSEHKRDCKMMETHTLTYLAEAREQFATWLDEPILKQRGREKPLE
jgi:hypothetical protein